MNREELKDKIYEILYRRFDAPRHGKYELNEATDEIAELPLPPAEGADPKKVQWSGYGPLGNISQKPLQPTAEGAEAFIDEMELGEPLQTGEFYYRSEVLEAMNKFATLHAQRIAEKMVSEVLYNQIQQAKQNECFSDLTALISEHYYPKEFLLWAINNDCRWDGVFLNLYDQTGIIYQFETTDELFNYWEENER